MMKNAKTLGIFGLLLSLSMAHVVYADNTPPGFDLAKWQNLLNGVATKGKLVSTILGESKSLSHIVPNDLTVSHQADYLTSIGFTDEQGLFHPGTTYAISENWQLHSDGNWYIEQWNRELSVTEI